MFEKKHQPVISRKKWLQRVGQSANLAVRVVLVSLAIGVAGYHFVGGLPWVDAFLEASMILAGMGPVAPLHNDAIKIFASLYALFSGFVLLAASGIVLAPFLHRLLHHFHADKE